MNCLFYVGELLNTDGKKITHLYNFWQQYPNLGELSIQIRSSFFFFASNKFYFPVSNLYLLLNSEVYFFHLPHSIHWLPFFLYLRLASPLVFAFWSPYPKIIPCLIPGKEHLMMSCKFGTTQRYSAQGEGALCLTVCVPWCKCLCPKRGLSLICTKGSVS